MEETYRQYFDAVSAPDAVGAAEMLDEALTRGLSASSLITDVLARAQRTVGEKWMRGEWSVADEHAATAVTKQVLAAVAPTLARPRAGLRVVVACAEGEWHSLPARLAGELLRADDLEVSLLGAGISTERMSQYLDGTAPDVLALSATVTTSLIGAARSIASARAVGVPVVVGGAAWGEGQRRAQALGAHLRLDDIRDIRSRLEEIRTIEPSPLPVVPGETHWLAEIPRETVAAALNGRSVEERPPSDLSEERRAEEHKELRWVAQHTAAAVLCDDATIVSDVLHWLLAMKEARGLAATPVLDGALCLADSIETEAPRAADMLRREVMSLVLARNGHRPA